MNYIWENYNSNVFFDVLSDISTYVEVWDIHSHERAFNPDYRFAGIFDPLLEHLRDKCRPDANIIAHYLVQIDNIRGALANDIFRRLYDEVIRGGGFGEVPFYNKLTGKDRMAFLDCLIRYYSGKQKSSVFNDAVECLLENGSVLYDSSRYIIHSTENGTDYSMGKLSLIKYFFLDAGESTIDVWGYKYAVIGNKCSIGEITII